MPDFSRSSSTSVVLELSNADADFEFLKLILEEEKKTNKAMPLDSLIVLSRLIKERRLSTIDLMASTQKSEASTRATVEKLSEVGLIEAHGSGRGRTFTLSAKLYRNEGQNAAYIRQAGFDSLQQEQMILSYIDMHGSLKRGDAAELCRVSPYQATRLLTKLKDTNKIVAIGKGKGTYYERRT
jgi:ATP-dependent DNA helicase RecG